MLLSAPTHDFTYLVLEFSAVRGAHNALVYDAERQQMTISCLGITTQTGHSAYRTGLGPHSAVRRPLRHTLLQRAIHTGNGQRGQQRLIHLGPRMRHLQHTGQDIGRGVIIE